MSATKPECHFYPNRLPWSASNLQTDRSNCIGWLPIIPPHGPGTTHKPVRHEELKIFGFVV